MPATRRSRRNAPLQPAIKSAEIPVIDNEQKPSSPQKVKKLKLIDEYGLYAASPFPNFQHPTSAECVAIFDLLTQAHPECRAVRGNKIYSKNSAETCGNVPDVIDSLVGTILSQNTSNKNSSGAKRSLDAAFGRSNWEAIAIAPREKVVETLHSGGLANKKAAVIQSFLNEVKERHGVYSLQHLASPSVSDIDVMKELQSYNGVGPKTASCVLLFCLERDSFAVDTHVYRLTRLLGWVPSKADRVMAQAHLDIRVPDNLKYGLHVLLIYHGRRCSGCKNTSRGVSCVLKTWLREHGNLEDKQIENRIDIVKDEVEELNRAEAKIFVT